jgi:hypothetical protein
MNRLFIATPADNDARTTKPLNAVAGREARHGRRTGFAVESVLSSAYAVKVN